MISLFRKIRQKLLSQNEATRNLDYSAGEIASAMIGNNSPYRDSIWVEQTILQSPFPAFRYGI